MTSPKDPAFAEAWALLETSFEPRERRELEALSHVLENGNAHLYYEALHESVLGIAVVWNFETFDFVEFLAVHTAARGQGTGTRMLEEVIALSDRLVLLEVHPPHDTVSEARIRFYERAGFQLNPYEYWQPPYQKKGETFPLQIMSSPRKLSAEEFNSYAQQIKMDVYERWY